MRVSLLVLGGLSAVLAVSPIGSPIVAADEESDRMISGVLGGLLGVPTQSPSATYTAQQRDRLVEMLQSGEYATSRQGEPVDMMLYGVPLTHVSHVYSARPIPPASNTPIQH